MLKDCLVGGKAWLSGVVQCTSILMLCRLQQVLAIVNMRQVRGACLPVINGTEVGSSGLVV